MKVNADKVDVSWLPILQDCLAQMNLEYRQYYAKDKNWLPGIQRCFNAFSLPFDKVRYILLGESPYPRSISANGYAFWDAAVGELWSEKGLSVWVNKATSLRNLMKLLISVECSLSSIQQASIAELDKRTWVQTASALFGNFLEAGFLLLNATLIFDDKKVAYHVQQWLPFMQRLLTHLAEKQFFPIQLLLFGKQANLLGQAFSTRLFPTVCAEHPYNVSFIQNQQVRDFFAPLHLLRQGCVGKNT